MLTQLPMCGCKPEVYHALPTTEPYLNWLPGYLHLLKLFSFEFVNMYLFPQKTVLILRLTSISLMTDTYHAKHLILFGNIKYSAYDVISRDAVAKPSSTHLCPAGTQPKVLSLQLYHCCRNRAILYPAVVILRITKNNDSQRCT